MNASRSSEEFISMGLGDSIKRSISNIIPSKKRQPTPQEMALMRDESRAQRVLERTHPALRPQVTNGNRLRKARSGSSIDLGVTHTNHLIKKEVLDSPEPARRSLRNASEQSLKELKLQVPNEASPGESTRAPDDEFGDPLLWQGPFEEFEISKDIYSTAYVIARNATEDCLFPRMWSGNDIGKVQFHPDGIMRNTSGRKRIYCFQKMFSKSYSFWPWENKHMWKLWGYLFFIIFSQLFVIVTFIFWFPPIVHSESRWEVCPDYQTEGCTDKDFNGLTVDLFDRVVRYRQVETEYPFYVRVFSPASWSINILRFLAFSWILAQVFLRDYANVVQLLKFRDFNLWFLPKVEEHARNKWAIIIPMIQFVNALLITCIAICVICAFDQAFDIVMNSLAFSFLGEIPEIFSAPLIDYMSKTKLDQIPADWGDIYYLVPEHPPEDDEVYTEPTWYRRNANKKAGLLCDFEFRWNPEIVPQSWIWESKVLAYSFHHHNTNSTIFAIHFFKFFFLYS